MRCMCVAVGWCILTVHFLSLYLQLALSGRYDACSARTPSSVRACVRAPVSCLCTFYAAPQRWVWYAVDAVSADCMALCWLCIPDRYAYRRDVVHIGWSILLQLTVLTHRPRNVHMSIDCDRVIVDIVSEHNACVTCGDHGHDLCLPDDREDMLTASNK